jgi:hypothetical protein
VRPLQNWTAEKARERAYDWKFVLGYSAIGLLVTSLAYALYHRMGYTMNPIVGARLIWLGISLPMGLTMITGLVFAWKRAKEARVAGVLAEKAIQELLPARLVVARAIWLLLLLIGNVVLYVM